MAVAGRMPHPFQLPAVKTGNDLITFFKEDAVNYLFQEDPNKKGATVKIDGINLAIKVVGDVDGKRMAFDPGSLNPLDVQGLTADNIDKRYKEGHGLIGISTQVIDVFETVLSDIQRELETLGLWNDPSYYLNLEYVKSGKSNIIGYEGVSTNFLVLHNISQFYEKVTSDPTKMSRSGAERPLVLNPKKGIEEPTKAKSRIVELSGVQKNALDSLIQKVNEANSDFQVYTSFPVQQKQADRAGIIKNIESALSSNFPIEITKNPEQFSEDQMNYFNDLLCGTLKDCLQRAVNPVGQSIKTIQYGTVPVEKKDLYFDIVLEGKAIDEIISVGNPDAGTHAKMLIDMAAIWHATRLLGNAILPAFTSELGDVENHEGIVLYDKEKFGVPEVKIVGEFLVDVVLYSPFSKRYKGPKQLKEGMAGSETIVLFPGAFKPPHKGYLETIRDIGIAWDKLYMIIGTGGTKTKTVGGEKIKIPKRTIHGEAITSDVSKTLFRKYFEDAGIGNYSLIDIKQGEQHFYVDKNGNEKSMTATPLTKVLDIIKGGEAGQTYVLLTIDEEAGRFKYILESQKDKIPEGVEIVVKEIEKQPEEDLGQVLHGTELRAAIESGDLETFKKYVPETSLRDAEQIFAYLGGKKKVSEQILDTVESLLAELDYQKQSKRIKTHAKRRKWFIGQGKQKAGPPYTKNPPKKRSKSGPTGFSAAEEAIENEDAEILDEEAVEEASSMAGGNVAGYAGVKPKRDDEDEESSLIREEPKDDTRLAKEVLKRLVEQELEEMLSEDIGGSLDVGTSNPFSRPPEKIKRRDPLLGLDWMDSQYYSPRTLPNPEVSSIKSGDPMHGIDWESFKTGGIYGDVTQPAEQEYKSGDLRSPLLDPTESPEESEVDIEQSQVDFWADEARNRSFDNYTSGPNAKAWIKRVGEDTYRNEILPQIQHVIKSVPISSTGDLPPRALGRFSQFPWKFGEIEVPPGRPASAFVNDPGSFANRYPDLVKSWPGKADTYLNTLQHEIDHAVDMHFQNNLSMQQADILTQALDPEKLERTKSEPGVGHHATQYDYITNPEEQRAYALDLRRELKRRTGRDEFTPRDIFNIWDKEWGADRTQPLKNRYSSGTEEWWGPSSAFGNFGRYLKIRDEDGKIQPELLQKAADTLNKIVKVDQPSQRARMAESKITKEGLRRLVEQEFKEIERDEEGFMDALEKGLESYYRSNTYDDQRLEDARDEMTSYYTDVLGGGRQAWTDRVGEEEYEKAVLPRIKTFLETVPIEVEPEMGGGKGGYYHPEIGVRVVDPLVGSDVVRHELAHGVDKLYRPSLSREQEEAIYSLYDPDWFKTKWKPEVDPLFVDRNEKDVDYEAMASETFARMREWTSELGRPVVSRDIETMCNRRTSDTVSDLNSYGINCLADPAEQAEKINNILVKHQSIQESNNKLIINKSKLKKIIEEEMSATALAASGGIVNDVANMLRDLFLNYAVQMRQETGQELEARQLQKQQQDMIAAQQQTIEDKKEAEEDTIQRNRWSVAAALGRARKGLAENKEDKEFIDDVMSYLLRKPGVNLDD